MAGGTYNGNVTIRTAESGASWIIIKKANATDNGSDPGWNTSYATNQTVINGLLWVYYGYFEIDAVTGSGMSGHGIKIHAPDSSASVVRLNTGGGPRHLHHLDIEGPGYDYGSLGSDGIYFNSTSAAVKGLCISHCWVHEIPRNGVTIGNIVGTSYSDYGMLFEHNVLGRTGGVGKAYPHIHGQGMQIGAGQPDSYLIIRNNTFYDMYGQGPISYLNGTHSQSRIYNNIFYTTNPSAYGNSTAIYMHELSVAASNMYIYNNTFYNFSGGYGNNIACRRKGGCANVEVKNNIWVGCVFRVGHVGVTSASNNDYYNNTGRNVPDGETNQKTESRDPFVNSAGYDFRLVRGAKAHNGGTSLSSVFTDDIIGTSRPQGSAWDIGAYEFIENTKE